MTYNFDLNRFFFIAVGLGEFIKEIRTENTIHKSLKNNIIMAFYKYSSIKDLNYLISNVIGIIAGDCPAVSGIGENSIN